MSKVLKFKLDCEIDELIQDYIHSCGYTEKQARKAAMEVVKSEMFE